MTTCLLTAAATAAPLVPTSGEQDRHRVIVSTDIGGTDADDFQSMVHFLLYTDVIDVEGIISSPWGEGRKSHILQVIDQYAVDFPNLKTHSDRYPTPDALRQITKQGAIDSANGAGVGEPTEGSEWIITCARRNDPRPLWVLVWGGIDDLAQALHDDPSIVPKLRIFFISGPNKKWSIPAYEYILNNHPDLWFIESNATYRGWFTGGNQSGDMGNTSFVATHVKGAGAMGNFFASSIDSLKAGDSPAIAYVLTGNPDDPTGESWGGRYVRAWRRSRLTVQGRQATVDDQLEQFGVIELISEPFENPGQASATLVLGGQRFPAWIDTATGKAHFRFMPKEARTWTYRIRSNVPSLDGGRGKFTSVRPSPQQATTPDPKLPRWWTDDPSADWQEDGHLGAKTISQWRADFLGDFAKRLDWCRQPR